MDVPSVGERADAGFQSQGASGRPYPSNANKLPVNKGYYYFEGTDKLGEAVNTLYEIVRKPKAN
jgi:hypothetical protein